MARQTVFPVTRVHEPLKVEVEVQNGRIVDAWLGGHLFRGFENMLVGRDPKDAALFTQRICGICSGAHAVAAAMAQQQAFGVAPTPTGQQLTNLIFAADIIQNHLRHFYLLVLYDYVKGPDMPPYLPGMQADFRLPPKLNAELLQHAKEGTVMAMRAHEAMAVFGAKAPHQQTIMPTGVTEQASSERLMAYSAILQELAEWVENFFLYDIRVIADYYKDYYSIGGGYGNFMSYGMFPAPVTGERAFKAGLIMKQGLEALDANLITEEIRYSWYTDDQESRIPQEGRTIPDRDKAEAYSWVKAPRYHDMPVESGPLARGFINGGYRRGISVMDRLAARAEETLKICRLTQGWLNEIVPNSPTCQPFTPLDSGSGVGLTDAMRGALGHWLEYRHNKVTHYQIITPTTWNFSPRDSKGMRGPVEQALIGTPVADGANLVEAGRVIRSFDPCFTCAVHLVECPVIQ
ncbi:nickel-dependent hydrogenase large subunit [Sporomusa acidovorans]|uniref:Periplasmic [NiFeSe] hydrogenase large subunit n=1 Tax=Sporomusa acidovorans (strain ATCC 49682 / DSM 3132 / Mol) TaxID=1123286 RepID=A0ABZ3J990_SPOA4|nr:nickel-dependent hydrogenase large subunit [Sporomusa acidovorans]OZC22942.1 periplasmic [NiFeSe] hydrogenase large subunit [Sporomusa acidovorans DSM 3132]SDE94519.1 hydrogenase large subunit [Sporomusa acidovorans]